MIRITLPERDFAKVLPPTEFIEAKILIGRVAVSNAATSSPK
jgi:hypothetical protein